MLIENGITEQFGISQDTENDLPGLVRKFTQKKTDSKKLERMLKGSVESLSRELPSSFQQAEVLKALNVVTQKYLAEYFHSRFGELYAVVSPEMFQLERSFKAATGYSGIIDIGLPLFAKAGLTDSKWGIKNARVISTKDRNSYEVNLIGDVPPLTQEAKCRVREARALYMDVCAQCLKEPEIGPLLDREIEAGNPGLTMNICWIPCIEDIKIGIKRIEKDPIVIGTLYERNYLLAQWDVLGEEPYKHYLKEFTESKKND